MEKYPENLNKENEEKENEEKKAQKFLEKYIEKTSLVFLNDFVKKLEQKYEEGYTEFSFGSGGWLPGDLRISEFWVLAGSEKKRFVYEEYQINDPMEGIIPYGALEKETTADAVQARIERTHISFILNKIPLKDLIEKIKIKVQKEKEKLDLQIKEYSNVQKDDTGRIINPEVAYDMARVEDMYHKKTLGIFSPSKKKIKNGEKAAEEYVEEKSKDLKRERKMIWGWPYSETDVFEELKFLDKEEKLRSHEREKKINE